MATLPVGRSPHRPAVEIKTKPKPTSSTNDIETEKQSWSPKMQEYYEEAKSPDASSVGFDAEKAFDTEVALDLATPAIYSPAPEENIPSGYEGPLSAEQLTSIGATDTLEQPSVSGDPKEGMLSPEVMAEIEASPDTSPPSQSAIESELKASLEVKEPIPPWEQAEPPGTLSRLWYQLTGQDRPPDDYNMGRMGSMITGGMLGYHIGSKTPPISFFVNPITGGLLFSGIGTAAGMVMPEATLELAESLGLLPKGYREKHAFSNARLLYEAENEAMLDFAFGGAITTAQGMWRLAGRYLSNADEASLKTASEIRKKFNINLMPIQLGKRSIARGFANVFGRFPWVGTKIVDRGLKTAEELTEAYKKLGGLASSRLGVLMADNEISKMIFRDGQELMKSFKTRFEDWYEQAWKMADEANVYVRPVFIKLRAKEILKELDKRATSISGGTKKDGEVLAKVRKFINTHVTHLENTQSLRQVDGFIGQIDEMLASLDGNQVKYAQTLMGRLRVAASYDMLRHAQGDEALKITRFIRQIDYQFSYTMNSLFESVTSKKFENVYRGGLKNTPKLSDAATKINIDQLAKYVIDLDSPMAIEQLFKLTGKDTFNSIVQRTLDNAVQKARNVSPDGTEQFFADRLAKQLGIETGTLTSKRASLETMLKLSKSPLTVSDVELLLDATRKLEGLKIPIASTFIARRLQLGGFQAALKVIVPGMVVASGAGGGIAGMVVSLIGVGTLIGGGKLISRMITDPKSAMLFKEVAKADANIIANWKLIPQILRLTLSSLFGDGSIGEEEFKKLNGLVDPLTNDLKQQYLEIFPPESKIDFGPIGGKFVRKTKEKMVKELKTKKKSKLKIKKEK